MVGFGRIWWKYQNVSGGKVITVGKLSESENVPPCSPVHSESIAKAQNIGHIHGTLIVWLLNCPNICIPNVFFVTSSPE